MSSNSKLDGKTSTPPKARGDVPDVLRVLASTRDSAASDSSIRDMHHPPRTVGRNVALPGLTRHLGVTIEMRYGGRIMLRFIRPAPVYAGLLIALMGCTSNKQAPTQSEPPIVSESSVTVVDAGLFDATTPKSVGSDAAASPASVSAAVAGTPPEVGVDASPSIDAERAHAGRLCIKAPGKHTSVGKGSSDRPDPGAWEARAKKVNGGLVLRIDGQEVTVRGDDGGMLDGLDPTERHRVGVTFVEGGSHWGFLLRFPEGEHRLCAYYNGFYDNWRLRPVGKRGCGPCAAD